jgi:hypothetical protein
LAASKDGSFGEIFGDRAVPRLMSRHFVLAALFAAIAIPATAQMPGSPFKSILDKASDSALDKLSQPGAFAADSAIRISLPGSAGAMSGMMKMAGSAGMGGGLGDSLNAAAGQAAAAAKPIFRAAIDKMSVQDAMAIAKGGSTGATQYLRKSSGDAIIAELSPLVRSALDRTGVLGQTDKLSAVGFDSTKITDYVSKKTADGIFTYMGREETSLRQNPTALGKMF